MSQIYALGAAMLLVGPAWGQLPGRSVALDTVAVHGQVRPLTLAPPGEATAAVNSHALGPGHSVAVWLGPPSAAHSYDVHSVTVHCSRFFNFSSTGRVQVQLTLPDSAGTPAGRALLPTPLELTSDQVQHARRGAVTLPLPARLALPPQGLFVQLTGLPPATERFVKDTLLGDKRQYRYAKLQNRQTGAYQVVNAVRFIALATLRVGEQPVTWQHPTPTARWYRLPASVPQCPKCLIYNYRVELGVTEL